jgi:hypothetical protein
LDYHTQEKKKAFKNLLCFLNLFFPSIIQPLSFLPLIILLIASARFTMAASTTTIASTIAQRKCKHKRHLLNYFFAFFHNVLLLGC